MTRAARLRLGLVATLVFAACGCAQPSPSTTSSPHGDACSVVAEPGPADELDRDGGDAIDGADFGGGRWRLCLAEPIVGAAETTAWCHWTPDRSTVLGISGLGVTIGAFGYDATLSIPRNEFALRRNDLGPDPVNAGYIPGLVPGGAVSADGRSGHLVFELVPRADPEVGAPVGVPPRLVGIMSWQCGDPPPPR